MSTEVNGASIASERFNDLVKELLEKYPDYKSTYDSMGKLTKDNKPTIEQLISCIMVSFGSEDDNLVKYIKGKLSEASNYFSYEEIDPNSLVMYNKAVLSKLDVSNGASISDIIDKSTANSVSIMIGGMINKVIEKRQLEGIREASSGTVEDINRIGIIKKNIDEGRISVDIDIVPLMISKFFGSRSTGWRNAAAIMNRRNEILAKDKDSVNGYMIARLPFYKDMATNKIYSEYKGIKFEVKRPNSDSKISVFTTVQLKEGSRSRSSYENYDYLSSGEANIAIAYDNKKEISGYFTVHPNSISKYYGVEYTIDADVMLAVPVESPFLHKEEKYDLQSGRIILGQTTKPVGSSTIDFKYVDISKVDNNIKDYTTAATLKRVLDYFEVPVDSEKAEIEVLDKFFFDSKYAKLRNKLISSPGDDSHKDIRRGDKKISIERPIVYNAITDSSIIHDLKEIFGDKINDIISSISVSTRKSKPATKTVIDNYLASAISSTIDDSKQSILYQRIKEYIAANDKNAKKIAKNQLQSVMDAYIINGHVDIEEDAESIKPYQAKDYDKKLIKSSFSDTDTIEYLLSDANMYEGDIIKDMSGDSSTLKALVGDAVGKTKEQFEKMLMDSMKKLLEAGVITDKEMDKVSASDRSGVIVGLTDAELDEALYYIMANVNDNILYSIPERKMAMAAKKSAINEGDTTLKNYGTVVYVNDGTPVESSKILRVNVFNPKISISIDSPEISNLVSRIINAMKVYMNNMGVGVYDRNRVVATTKDLINEVLAGDFTFDEWLDLNKMFKINMTDDDIDNKVGAYAKESLEAETNKSKAIRPDSGLAALDKLPLHESEIAILMKTLLEGTISDEERAAIEEYLKLYPQEEELSKDSLFYEPADGEISKDAWAAFVKDVEAKDDESPAITKPTNQEAPAEQSSRARALGKIHEENNRREKLEDERQKLRIEITKALNDRRRALNILVKAGKIKPSAAMLAMKNAIKSLPNVLPKLESLFKDGTNLGWEQDDTLEKFMSFGDPRTRDRFYVKYGGPRLYEE